MGALAFRSTTWSVRDVLTRFPQLRLDPDYQREGNIWSLSRRQLFLDSILNGFDSPKIYLHELVPPEFADDSLQRFAVIDGRQRLEALWAFNAGQFPLAADFRLLGEPDMDPEEELGAFEVPPGGRFSQLTLPGLRDSNQLLARRFFAYPLTVVIVTTEDTSYIEEMFFRLNEGSPLTAAEKRNRGELLRAAVRRIQQHPAFSRFSVSNRRGRHSDLAVRFLFFEDSDATVEKVQDMRAKTLDDFVARFRPPVGANFDAGLQEQAEMHLARLAASVGSVLDWFVSVFDLDDPLLKQTGDILTLYIAARSRPGLGADRLLRQKLQDFFTRANALAGLDEEQLTPDELSVLDVFGAVQGTTTGSYLAERALLVQRFVLDNLNLRLPSS
jgi:hypothetical protein